MKTVSDTTIRSYLRSVLTHRRIELSCLDLGSFRGTVRLRGELRRIGGANVTAETLETLEHEIQQARGVRRVHLHFINWRKRDEDGEWVEVVRNLSLQEIADALEAESEADEKVYRA